MRASFSGLGGRPILTAGPRTFLVSAAMIFGMAGIAKIFSATGSARALDLFDPLIGISFRHLLLMTGLVEFTIALLCLSTVKVRICLLCIAGLSTNFVIYRTGLWLVGWHSPCRCLGNLTEVLTISPEVADLIMKVLLTYLTVGSYWWLYLLGGQPSRTCGTAIGTVKTFERSLE